MPSTLYESVKQSVIEYTQIKKRNERKQDKLIFRWKLITLCLAIVLIVLIGLFSILLGSINSIPEVKFDKTYLLSLLQQTSDRTLSTVTQADYLLNGLYLASDKYGANFEWNEAQKLYSTTNTANLTNIYNSIKDHSQLLFLFSNFDIPTPTRFGLRAHRGFTDYQTAGGVTTVQDDSQSRFSSFFNYNDGNKMMSFDVPDCNLFSYNSSTLTLFQSITFNNQSSNVYLNVVKPGCFFGFYNDYTSAQTSLLSLVGIKGPTQPYLLTGFGLQVYSLHLSQSINEQI